MLEDNKLESEKIYQAAKILNLGEKASLDEIKNAYKNLMKKHHPDNYNKEEKEKVREKVKKINKAYEIIMNYCDNYRYSFQKEQIAENLPIDQKLEENVFKQFKNDPHWT
ncbi:MAG: J domain-containing protein [bacterium]